MSLTERAFAINVIFTLSLASRELPPRGSLFVTTRWKLLPPLALAHGPSPPEVEVSSYLPVEKTLFVLSNCLLPEPPSRGRGTVSERERWKEFYIFRFGSFRHSQALQIFRNTRIAPKCSKGAFFYFDMRKNPQKREKMSQNPQK